MSIEKEILYWLKSAEFQAFYEKAEYAMALTLDSQSDQTKHLQEILIEMGRRYNHFLFSITEEIISKANAQGIKDETLLSKAVEQFVWDIEKHIQKEYPIVFPFFLNYRAKAKEIQQSQVK